MSLDDIIASREAALTVEEVADYLNVSRRLIYQLVSIGEVPHFRVGKAVRFEPAALASWLRGRLKSSGRQAEYRRIIVAEQGKGGDGPFGYSAQWTKWWRDVLMPKGQN